MAPMGPGTLGRALPRVASGDPAAGARMLADAIPAVIARAEAMDAHEVAGRLRMALLAAERRAAEGRQGASGQSEAMRADRQGDPRGARSAGAKPTADGTPMRNRP